MLTTMTDLGIIASLMLILLILLVLPFVLYRAVKFVVYAAHMARRDFKRNHPEEEESGKERPRRTT